MATLWNPVPIPVFDPSTGERAAGALVYFFVGGTPTTPLTVYTSDDGTVPLPNPVVADANGVFPAVFIPYGPYGYRVTAADGTIISPNILTIQNPAPPASGGGGGIVVTSDQIFQTGDPLWRIRSGTMTGFVRMNDLTIGAAGSGATERANADTSALFAFLWNNCPDAVAPVSGGRGATAASDFAANKTIGVPTMAGYIAGGLDDSGNNAANRLQVSTTISTTNASTSATVASATGLFIGMRIVSTNIQAGTTISAISGTTITLSAQATATASGTAARFSVFSDAQVVGSVGGTISSPLLLSHLPSFSTSGTSGSAGPVSGSTSIIKAFGVQTGASATAYGSGAGSDTTIPVSFTDPAGRAVSTTFTGENRPVSLAQPTRLGTWYMKI